MAKSTQDSTLSTPQDVPGSGQHLRKYHETKSGIIYHGDSRLLFERHVTPASVNLIMTSPPFGLVRKKTYGNVDAHEYLAWFKPFGKAFHQALKPSGSLVIDIGGAWIPGQPTRSLYHYSCLSCCVGNAGSIWLKISFGGIPRGCPRQRNGLRCGGFV